MKTETFGIPITIAWASGVGVLDSWRCQYEDKTGDHYADKHAITERLISLGDAPSADAVAEVIGNKSWTHPRCSVCEKNVLAALYVGTEYPVCVCVPCMKSAIAIIEQKP